MERLGPRNVARPISTSSGVCSLIKPNPRLHGSSVFLSWADEDYCPALLLLVSPSCPETRSQAHLYPVRPVVPVHKTTSQQQKKQA